MTVAAHQNAWAILGLGSSKKSSTFAANPAQLIRFFELGLASQRFHTARVCSYATSIIPIFLLARAAPCSALICLIFNRGQAPLWASEGFQEALGVWACHPDSPLQTNRNGAGQVDDPLLWKWAFAETRQLFKFSLHAGPRQARLR
jgi:hypothetical protein